MDKNLNISILGAGKVGSVIGIAAAQAGINVIAVGNRNLEKAEACAKNISPITKACSLEEAALRGDLVFLTVSDDAISAVCEKLASGNYFKKCCIVAHCSGALSSTELRAARDLSGCKVASFHPLLSFSKIETALEHFPSSYCFIEGEDPATKELVALGNKLGLKTEIILTENKLIYHAAAVFALNFVTTIIDSALVVGEVAGINKNILTPALISGVKNLINNIETLGTKQALTGPIARGDINLVNNQLKNLAAKNPKLGELYSLLSEHTVYLAEKAGKISPAQVQSFLGILK